MHKSQLEVNTMIKHYETHSKANMLQHAGAFDVYFLRWRAWGIPNHSYYTTGVDTLTGRLGVLSHPKGLRNGSYTKVAIIYHLSIPPIVFLKTVLLTEI